MARKRKKAGNPPLLLRWMKEGLGRGKGKKTQKGLAELLGMDPSQVTLRMKDKTEIRFKEFPVIAAYLGKELPPDLVSLSENNANAPAGALGPEQDVPARIRIEAIIAEGVWRELGAKPVALAAERVSPSTDQRLHGMRQYACRVEKDGTYAICVPFEQIRTTPRAADTLHVRRKRGPMQEDTLRTVRLNRGRVELHLIGGGKDGIIFYPSSDPSETIELRGLVVGYFTPTAF